MVVFKVGGLAWTPGEQDSEELSIKHGDPGAAC